MPYRKTVFTAGEHYHLYNRGNNYEDVFRHREDYLRFLRLMRKHLVESRTSSILAYCLMPNHYHIFARLLGDGLSSAMQAMTLSYVKSFNLKYGRIGRVFQGPFRSIHVAEDGYCFALIAYIHRNPVEAGLVKSAEDWEYSSFLDFARLRNGTLVDRSVMTQVDTTRIVELAQTLSDADREKVRGLTAE